MHDSCPRSRAEGVMDREEHAEKLPRGCSNGSFATRHACRKRHALRPLGKKVPGRYSGESTGRVTLEEDTRSQVPRGAGGGVP